MNGDFNNQYIETWDSEQWACRWDRHPNTHNILDYSQRGDDRDWVAPQRDRSAQFRMGRDGSGTSRIQ